MLDFQNTLQAVSSRGLLRRHVADAVSAARILRERYSLTLARAQAFTPMNATMPKTIDPTMPAFR